MKKIWKGHLGRVELFNEEEWKESEKGINIEMRGMEGNNSS